MKFKITPSGDKFVMKRRVFGFWCYVGDYKTLAGGNCIGACPGDYLLQFVIKRFESRTEAAKYALDNYKRVKFV